ncbi:MAG: nuclease A inhibitor family protein [bacterium]
MRLAHALQALAHDLPNPWDESTDFFHQFTAAMPANTKLDPESFRKALDIGARYEIDLSSADQRLTDLGNAGDDLGEDTAGGFRQLAVVMHATLTDLSLAFARGKGVVRVRVWLFGRTEDGTIVGLQSLSTET